MTIAPPRLGDQIIPARLFKKAAVHPVVEEVVARVQPDRFYAFDPDGNGYVLKPSETSGVWQEVLPERDRASRED